jgi:hypothetical protein
MTLVVDLTVADVGAAWPGWPAYVLRQAAHMALGVFAAYVPRQWAATAALCWIWKEMTFDLPGGGFAPLFWADTFADLLSAAAGLLLAQGRIQLTNPKSNRFKELTHD